MLPSVCPILLLLVAATANLRCCASTHGQISSHSPLRCANLDPVGEPGFIATPSSCRIECDCTAASWESPVVDSVPDRLRIIAFIRHCGASSEANPSAIGQHENRSERGTEMLLWWMRVRVTATTWSLHLPTR